MPNTIYGLMAVILATLAAVVSRQVDNKQITEICIYVFYVSLLLFIIDRMHGSKDKPTRVWRPGRRRCNSCRKWYTYNHNGFQNHWKNNPRHCPDCARPKN